MGALNPSGGGMFDWEAMFLPSLPLVELVLRGTVTFLVLLALERFLGQRESGGLGVTDLLVIVLIAQAAAPGLIGTRPRSPMGSSWSRRSWAGASLSTPSPTDGRGRRSSSRANRTF
ncbi:hypothetical protein ACFC3F_06485 [Microbacterium sp. NPDC055910]|uniref:hypothetical protein n=1 Tax=Microbacterium sp. NPDC055910 TaxID=3345659 RepID=UPI0035D57575